MPRLASLNAHFFLVSFIIWPNEKYGQQLSICIIVTRHPVPAEMLKDWRPHVSSVPLEGTDLGDQSSDEINIDTSSPTFSPVALPSTQPSLRRRLRRNRSEDEVEQDIISISSTSGKKFDFCI